MPTTYNTPGVYVEEKATLPASVVQVPTAIPAFIGLTATKPVSLTGFRKIGSLVEYEAAFGPGTDSKAFLYSSIKLFYANGGGDAYVYSVGTTETERTKEKFLAGLTALEKEAEPTLILFPDAVSLSSGLDEVQNAAMNQCKALRSRFCIIDVPADNSMLGTTAAKTIAIADFRTTLGPKGLEYGAAYGPWLQLTTPGAKKAEVELATGAATKAKTADDAAKAALNKGQTVPTEDAAIKAALTAAAASEATEPQKKLAKAINTAKAKAAADLAVASIEPIKVPASGAIAGIYAAVDAQRGVWKAPANVSINGVIGLTETINDHDQESLNVDADGKSINAIRAFPGRGILVWGARTLAGNDNEWRYVNVRRLFIMAEESIRRSTAFVVFEPNDENTWIKVKAMIENYLSGLWRQGALAGSKPEQAFFVNVGLGSTMTPQDILEGYMRINVGMAAVRPSEFVIIQFSHKLQEA